MSKLKKIKPTETPAPPPAKAGTSTWRRLAADARIVVAMLVLLAATFVTYRESLSGRLFFDDHAAIETNPNVHALVNPERRWQWRTWVRAASSSAETPFSGRPVVALSFALNHLWATTVYPSKLPGYDGLLPTHTAFFHYVNLALHMLVTLLLFALVRRTMTAPVFGDRFQGITTATAFCLALVWAVHPLNTETVVYVTQRTEQLISLFLLLTMYCSMRALDAGSPRRRVAWEVAAVAACLLGMGSKENMIAAPLLVVAYDRAFRFPDWRTTFRSRPVFYFAIASTWIALALIMAQNPRGTSVGFQDARFPWYEYLITQCWCLWRYFWLTIIPLGSKLCVDYGRRPVLEFHHTAPGAFLVLSLLGFTIWGWIRRPWIGFLGTWFFLILAPTSSFYPIVTEIGAERRMYLPSAAILMGAVAGVVGIAQALRARKVAARGKGRGESPASFDRFKWAGIGATVALAVLLGYTSHERNKVYQDDLTLYGHIVEVFPDNDRGCNNFGKINMDFAKTEEALALFNRAVKIDPEYVDAFTNRGIVFLGAHHRTHYDLSIADSTEALNWAPWGTNALNNRATAYMEATLYDRSLADYKRLIAFSPRSHDTRFNQANLFMRMGETEPKYNEDALASIDEALRLNTHSYRSYNTRGSILTALKRPEEAILAFGKALEMIRLEAQHQPPDSEAAHSWQALEASLLRITADRRTVEPKLRDAMLRFPYRPVMAAIYNNRAEAYRQAAKAGDRPKYLDYALHDLTRAIFVEEQNPRFYLYRGEIYLERNRLGEARLDFDTAVRLAPQWAQARRARMQIALQVHDLETARTDAEELRKLGLPLDAETTKLVNDVLSPTGAR